MVKEANYSGIITDEKLTFKSHIENIVRKMVVANTSMDYIKHCLNRSSQRFLHETLVLSTLHRVQYGLSLQIVFFISLRFRKADLY